MTSTRLQRKVSFGEWPNSLPQLIEQRQEDTLKKLVSILLTDVAPSKAAKDE